uniref:RING-type domain-containing protein n=1 Tax=Opuntia streptacantha TaxID=393608 RepID=A0A7C9CUQ4_OPUST
MGFPVGYTEVFIPTLLIHTLTLLTIIKKIVFSLFNFLGFPPDFLEPTTTTTDVPPSATGSTAGRPPIAAVVLRELLPLGTVEEEEEDRESSCCAVCLYELCRGEEIRWLCNCKHIFHRDCLDRWMDLDHRTCPLCRTPFLNDHLLDEFNRRLVAAHAYDHTLYVDHTVF